MKKLTALILVLLLLLAGCGKDDDPTPSTDATSPSTGVNEATTAPTDATEPAQTEPATEPAHNYQMYAGAVQEYLTPMEDFSWEREHDPEFVMLHFTSNVVNNRKDPFNMDALRNLLIQYEVSVHYIIGRDGTVHAFVPEDRVAWHAGSGEWAGDEKYTNKMNHYAIGIELAAIGSRYDMATYLTKEEYDQLDDDLLGYTDEQYTALKALIEDICTRHNIPMDRDHVIGHEDYSSNKTDPGELFDWDRIIPD